MKLWIPSIGDHLTLIADYDASIQVEQRNQRFLTSCIGGLKRYKIVGEQSLTRTVRLLAGEVLRVERLYIRRGKPSFDSITFSIPLEKPRPRFWVKLTNAREIDFEIGIVKKPKPFWLMNRYQDGLWETLHDEEFDDQTDAIIRASELSKNAISHGMVRVMAGHQIGARIIIEFPAGGF